MIRSVIVSLALVTFVGMSSTSEANAWRSHGGSWGGGWHSVGSWGCYGGWCGGSCGSHGGWAHNYQPSYVLSHHSYGGHYGRVHYPQRLHNRGWHCGGVVYPGYAHAQYGHANSSNYEGHVQQGHVYVQPGLAPTHSTPAKSTAPVQQPPIVEPIPFPTSQVPRRTGIITVSLPSDATVYVNEHLTRSTGPNRRFNSDNLTSGKTYTFNVRAEAMRNGQRVAQTQVVQLSGGELRHLSFDLKQQRNPITTITIDVPTDAKVYLASNEMKKSGSRRVFTTDLLAAGQQWNKYRILVTVKRNGRLITQEQDITLVAGMSQHLSFGLNEPTLLSAR